MMLLYSPLNQCECEPLYLFTFLWFHIFCDIILCLILFHIIGSNKYLILIYGKKIDLPNYGAAQIFHQCEHSFIRSFKVLFKLDYFH